MHQNEKANSMKYVQEQISNVLPEYYPGDETIVRKYDYRKLKTGINMGLKVIR